MQCAKLKTYMETGRVVFLPARSIRPNPAQPRRRFEENALAELTESIRCHGVIQPLSVRRTGAGYELIAGERRLRAAQAAGLSEIPCIVMTLDDAESGLVALVENLQRQDLDFIEEALGISRLIKTQHLSQDQAARMLGLDIKIDAVLNGKGEPAKDAFVGWSGLFPISVMMEYVFGIRPHAQEKKIVWKVNLTDRHGVEQYPLGELTVDHICEARSSAEEEPQITVKCAEPITVEVHWNGNVKTVIAN